MFETLSSGVVDAFPAKLSSKKTLVTAALSAAMFLIGLPFTTNVSEIVFSHKENQCSSRICNVSLMFSVL